METISEKFVHKLLQSDDNPCISLYMPTHRHHPNTEQDPIRFKNMIKEAETSLTQKYSEEETQVLLEPLIKIQQDYAFWNHNLDGLAIFRSENTFEVARLPINLEQLLIVADTFHTKPLRKFLQSGDRFHLLGLSLHKIKLYEGNRHSLEEIDLKGDIPTTIQEALGEELTDKHLTAASYGGVSGESSTMHHGHGSKKEEVDVDAERFFRMVSNYVETHYSKPFDLPLLLAALPEHHHLFQEVSKNPHLLPEGIKMDPFSSDERELAKMAWEVIQPSYLQRLTDLGERFGEAQAAGRGSDDYKELAVAAKDGRIDTLLVEADKVIAARITNLETGNTQRKYITNPRIDDLTDDMGELVMKMGGKVVIVPCDNMPTETGLAGIFRY
ncbi:baeRF3 domain-containing protein [Lunatimonas lonarensis]|nr:hypothetical protein [Lunatimonas lonarensis]